MRYLIAALAAFFSSVAQAEHVPEPGSTITGTIVICDTAEAWEQVWATHEDRGLEPALHMLNALQMMPSPTQEGDTLCGMMQGVYVYGETVKRGWLKFGSVERWSMITHLTHPSGREFFALFSSNTETRREM